MTAPVVDGNPFHPAAVDAWILERRGARNSVAADSAYAFLVEEEPSGTGTLTSVATIFLTNRECPFRCLMCDLWKNTLTESLPPGVIPRQIEQALAKLPPARQVKLYNSGSFFDPRAIPPEDYPSIADLVRHFDRVIVECHPAFVGPACVEFQNHLGKPLEIAIGLETIHPHVLERLNKRMTLTQFCESAAYLKQHRIDLRVFLLLRPPFLSEEQGIEWACKSLVFAQEQGASACAIIPTRSGNGALDALQLAGQFAPPTIRSLEKALEFGIRRNSGRVLADLWDLQRFRTCAACFPARLGRLETMNREQTVPLPVHCELCA